MVLKNSTFHQLIYHLPKYTIYWVDSAYIELCSITNCVEAIKETIIFLLTIRPIKKDDAGLNN